MACFRYYNRTESKTKGLIPEFLHRFEKIVTRKQTPLGTHCIFWKLCYDTFSTRMMRVLKQGFNTIPKGGMQYECKPVDPKEH